MGYYLHITRAEHWSDDKKQIAAQEWLELIKEDPELIPSPENGEYFVIWRGSTEYPETWFDWQDGNIYTKNPDKATIKKLCQLAQKLNAQVQGDDGEIWDPVDIESFIDHDRHADVSQTRLSKSSVHVRTRRFLKIGCAATLLVFLLVFLIFLVLLNYYRFR